MANRRLVSIICLVLGGSLCHMTEAGFVNAVEAFDGTVKDTTTWQEYLLNPGPSRISQNDAITFDEFTEYVATSIPISIGQTVRVDVINVTDLGSSASIGLGLSGHNQSTLGNTTHILRMLAAYNSGSDTWWLIGQHKLPVGGTLNSFFGLAALSQKTDEVGRVSSRVRSADG